MPGLFWLTAVLAILAVGVILFIVPDAEKAPVEPGALSEAEAKEKVSFGKVLLDPQLLRLNFGIFVLHMAQMTLFVVDPGEACGAGLSRGAPLGGVSACGPSLPLRVSCPPSALPNGAEH